MRKRTAAPADEVRPLDRSAATDADADPSSPAVGSGDPSGPVPLLADGVDLAGLSIAGITRRRVAWVAVAFIAVWVVIVFARQVGDAAAASSRAAQLALDNAALAAEVQSLEGEVALIVRPDYVRLQAHAYGLGTPNEIPFTLDPSVPAPVEGAPGSATVRLGARIDRQTPLDSWLSLLFGPGR